MACGIVQKVICTTVGGTLVSMASIVLENQHQPGYCSLHLLLQDATCSKQDRETCGPEGASKEQLALILSFCSLMVSFCLSAKPIALATSVLRLATSALRRAVSA